MLVYASIYDPVSTDEGTIDPLGLSNIAERLAAKLVPGVRERMRHPRFLTTMAASSMVTRTLNDEVVTETELEPFLVFEWMVVQALYVVYKDEDKQLAGMPGKLKAQDAFRSGKPLSNSRYLKNAYTFGFHGVYRTLAEELDIVKQDELGANGIKLLKIWEEEQALNGFTNQLAGKGKKLLDDWRKGVRKGLEKGEVPYNWHWLGFKEIAPFFAPYKAGRKERQFLGELISTDHKGFRGELWKHLPVFLQLIIPEQRTESAFHLFLRSRVNVDLKELLEAIVAYEDFCRKLNNCFYYTLQFLTRLKSKVSLSQIAREVEGLTTTSDITDSYKHAVQLLSGFPEGVLFEKEFAVFEQVSQKKDLLAALFDHHQRIQKQKPPFPGKLPWVDQFSDGDLMIRPAYQQDIAKLSEHNYVNSYRLAALTQFYEDLNRRK